MLLMDSNAGGRDALRGQTDPLTGLPGRRAFLDALERRAAPEGVGVLAVDLDGLGQANRTFGYLQGDECIRLAAQALVRVLSERGKLFRAEGGTFALLACAGEAELQALAERVQGLSVRAGGGPALAVTAGAAAFRAGTDRDLKDTWGRACRAMRARKRHAVG